MQKTLKNISDDRLRAHVIWLPMFPGDSRDWANIRSDEFNDKRGAFPYVIPYLPVDWMGN